MERKYYYSIDIMKYICAIMVLCIHMAPFEQISPLFNDLWGSVICRVAVPFFFMASSFFFFSKKDNVWKRFLAYGKRILILYVIYNSLYLAIFGIEKWGQNLLEILQKIIFTGVCEHLWYFIGVLVAIGCVILAEKMFGQKLTIVIAMFAYFIGTIISTYFSCISSIDIINKLVNNYMNIFLSARNGVLFGMLFVIMGKVFGENEETLMTIRWRCWGILFMVSSLMICTEGVFITKFTMKTFGRDLFLTLPIFAWAVFGIVMKFNEKCNICHKKDFYNVCIYSRNISTVFYGLHYIFIFCFPIANILLKFLIVLIVNTIISFLIVCISRNVKQLSCLRYLY